MNDPISPGCPECRNSDGQMADPAGGALVAQGSAADAFTGYSYFSCDLFRCSRCGTSWADVYFEWDDEETKMDEWGHRVRFAVALTGEQCATIDRARGARSIDAAEFFLIAR